MNSPWRKNSKKRKEQCQGTSLLLPIRYITNLGDSYLEGVTAPDGPIVEKPEGIKDGKLGETAS